MTQTSERAFAAPPVETPTSRRLSRLSGLDGLRAVAVISVVVFHLDVSLAPGGFIGVDIFFVISGFLITRILTTELAEEGRIHFARFYYRRARRLLPAAVLLIAVVVAASLLVWRDQLPTLTGSALSSLGYVTNWWLIAAHQSYFVSVGRPPMLQHLWSLAVEEQFYAIWPLVIALVAGAARRSRRRARDRVDPSSAPLLIIAIVAGILAVASTIDMTLIARAEDLPYGASTSRVYFGTDTHSMGLFLGAAAGAWTVWWQRRRRSDRDVDVRPGAARSLVALLVPELIALTCFVAVVYAIVTVDEYRPALYQGGFLLIDALVLVVLLVVIRGGSALGRLLDTRLAVWIGRRSYSIYLWHWPVVLVTRPGIDVHGPTLLLNLARLGLILLLAEGSYRYVEVPLRLRGLTGLSGSGSSVPLVRSTRHLGSDARMALAGLMGLLCLLVLVAAGSPLLAGFDSSKPVSLPQVTAAPSPLPIDLGSGPDRLGPSDRPDRSPLASQPTGSIASATQPSVQPMPTPSPRIVPVAAGPVVLSAFGDSVLLGAGRALGSDVSSLSLDAVEGRQANVVLDAVSAAHARGSLAAMVVIDTGNNGVISPGQLDSTLSLLSDRQRVILLTDRVPRDWQDPNNQTLRTVSARFQNVVLIDWLHDSDGHAGWFYQDGYHVDPAGAAAFAQLIVQAARA